MSVAAGVVFVGILVLTGLLIRQLGDTQFDTWADDEGEEPAWRRRHRTTLLMVGIWQFFIAALEVMLGSWGMALPLAITGTAFIFVYVRQRRALR